MRLTCPPPVPPRAPGLPSQPGGGRALFWPLLTLLVVAAWAVLWLWSASPYGRYLDHGGWGDAGALAALCRAIPQGDIVVPAVLHAAAWVLMIAAMMLPTTFPLLAMFRRITGARPDAGRLAALVVLGFFAAWLAFGMAAHLADAARALGRRAERAWFVANGWMVGAGGAGRRGPLPVERPQVPLSRRVPDAVRLRRLALARRVAVARGASHRRRPRRLLRGLLLGADADDVRRRRRQRRAGCSCWRR